MRRLIALFLRGVFFLKKNYKQKEDDFLCCVTPISTKPTHVPFYKHYNFLNHSFFLRFYFVFALLAAKKGLLL